MVDRGRFRTTPKAIEKWFTDVAPARVAMEAGTHSIWISAQLQELGHEVIVANVRELRAISHSDRRSGRVDAEKLARYARLDPNILRPIRDLDLGLSAWDFSDEVLRWLLHGNSLLLLRRTCSSHLSLPIRTSMSASAMMRSLRNHDRAKYELRANRFSIELTNSPRYLVQGEHVRQHHVFDIGITCYCDNPAHKLSLLWE
ncbi:hypothetical protein [Tunturiibacter psychrotolerans]|uniref:hypothetical protein n=1 Tax=Tunturiibacter psychrotolerans TaxID=3069686 RepID=UPI0033401686